MIWRIPQFNMNSLNSSDVNWGLLSETNLFSGFTGEAQSNWLGGQWEQM